MGDVTSEDEVSTTTIFMILLSNSAKASKEVTQVFEWLAGKCSVYKTKPKKNLIHHDNVRLHVYSPYSVHPTTIYFYRYNVRLHVCGQIILHTLPIRVQFILNDTSFWGKKSNGMNSSIAYLVAPKKRNETDTDAFHFVSPSKEGSLKTVHCPSDYNWFWSKPASGINKEYWENKWIEFIHRTSRNS